MVMRYSSRWSVAAACALFPAVGFVRRRGEDDRGSSDVVRTCRIVSIAQVRAVASTRATLGFTHLGPKTPVFEVALPSDNGSVS